MQCAHHLAHAVKRCFGNARHRVFQFVLCQPFGVGVVDKCALGGFAYRLSVVKLGVAAQSHCGGKQFFVVAISVYDGHFVLRKCACLVRADNFGAAQCFHRRKFADDGVFLAHVCYADTQHDCDGGGKTFGYCRDSQTDCNHKRIYYYFRADGVGYKRFDKVERKHHNADDKNTDGQHSGKLPHLYLQRCFFFFCLRKHVGDFAHFGSHAGCDYHGFCTSVSNGAAHIQHIFAVAERDFAVDCMLEFVHGHAFACQRGFLYLATGNFQYAAVGRYAVACFKQHNVADNKVTAVYKLHFAVAQHLAVRFGHVLQGFYCLFGFAFLHDAENGIQQYNRRNDDDVGKVLHRRACFLHERQHKAYHGCNHQNDYHRVGQLLEKLDDKRRFFAFGKFVFAVCGKAVLCLFGGQTA